MQKWLLSRLFELDQPAPHFAFFGTINWMRALALLLGRNGFDGNELQEAYSAVERRTVDPVADTLVFENIFLAFNHLAGLMAISNAENGYDVCRPAISAWYHGIYSAAVAMVAATTNQSCTTSDDVISAWHESLVDKDLVRFPFSPSVSSLVKAVSDEEIGRYRENNTHDLSRTPENVAEAWGGVVSYLHGTAKFERERLEDLVRATPEFLALGVVDYRTKLARALRDDNLKKAQINFVVQARRYAGKASYRDSIFLSYGEDRQAEIDQFLIDLGDVATAFLRMACVYCSRRVQYGAWSDFVDDIEANSRLSIGVDVMRC